MNNPTPPNTANGLRRLHRIVLAVACSALTFIVDTSPADGGSPTRIKAISANAGSTAVLSPTDNPTVFTASVKGVIQSRSLGTCVNQASLEVTFPTTPDQPVVLNGAATWTSIATSNGVCSLNVTIAGTATPDPANPGFYNAKYKVTVIGGSGAYASAKGRAEIQEVVMFTSQTTATATWTLKGLLVLDAARCQD